MSGRNFKVHRKTQCAFQLLMVLYHVSTAENIMEVKTLAANTTSIYTKFEFLDLNSVHLGRSEVSSENHYFGSHIVTSSSSNSLRQMSLIHQSDLCCLLVACSRSCCARRHIVTSFSTPCCLAVAA
jgi:hypothetical protein